MQLLRSDEVRKTRVVSTFGHRPFAPALLLLFVVAGPAFLGALAWAKADVVPWWGWVVGAPFLVVGALLVWVIVAGVLNAVLACFRSGNWVVKVADHGLYLKLRSYQNEHFDGDEATVVFVAYSEIYAAGKVVEIVDRNDGDGGRHAARRAWLELRTHELETAEIAEAIAHERLRPAPESRFLGIRSRSRTHHVPVFVAEPGVLRVEWRGMGLLGALPVHIARLPQREVYLNRQRESGREARQEIVELVRRGERTAAVERVRESEGIGLTEAVRVVDELVRAA